MNPQRDEIIRLAKLGNKPAHIATMLGIKDTRKVQNVLTHARRVGIDIPHWLRQSADTRYMKIEANLFDALSDEAAKRELKPRTLVRKLLCVIRTDPSLVGAILDDGEQS